ncbi:uncharacterized protein ARMOST_04250 [Armillaria ostoyae]|uniref:DUF6535 domain-containing protein n=1 Tax=Armillaria ostoyae TaxID=47428 RepID=A0A284QWU5_ARMOS|nr:uncharacterized protein ARMOST_04250 [Armillaria ostoyae]
MSSPRELDEASSSKSKGKAVDPSEHPNIWDGGGNTDEPDKDEVTEDAEPVDKEIMHNTVKPVNPAMSSKAKKAFGMPRAQPNTRRGNDPSNYEDIFPEDPMYAEMVPNARVWRTHQAESVIHDANMVEEIWDNVDVLLVFAGLFSAVVTMFVVQTSQSLQADYVQVSASLLFELVLVQHAIANGSPVDTVPVSSLNPLSQTAFVPAATDVWVNGLWFTSLFLSLTTALVAVLVKQWLHHYVVLPSGTPCERCCIRQYRYLGFQKWRVEVIVGVLPVLMHLALALFFIGLSLFLHPLRAALSWVVGTGTVLLIVAYVTMTILPMCFPQCPYHTPLCDLAYPPYTYVTSLFQKHYHRLRQLLQRWHKKKVQSAREVRLARNNHSGRNRPTAKPNSLKQLELEAVEKASLRLSVDALHWLFSALSNPAVQSIVVESIGGLPMGALDEVEDVFRGSSSIVDVRANLLSSLTEWHADTWGMSISSGMERKFECLLRSGMFISRVEELWTFIDVSDQLGQNEFGATLPGVFLHNILSLETPAKFPPIVWKNLIQSATASWDPKLFNIDDQFPMLLYRALTRSSIVEPDIPKQQLFASPLVVDFQQAVKYVPKMALKYALCWLSHFVLLPDIYETLDTCSLMLLELIHKCLDLEVKPKSVWKILESVIVNTPIFSQNAIDSKYDECARFVLDCYSKFVRRRNLASLIRAPSSALQLLVTFMTTQWSTVHTSTRTRDTFRFLKHCLERRFWTAYDVFYQQQCLKFLMMQPVSSRSALLLEAYVIGIAIAIHPRYNDPEDNQTISQAIDCLHEPGNLLFVCSTLAIYTHETVYAAIGKLDIMTALAQIRPLDPAWGNCLQRLQALADAWDENCFVGVEREKEDLKGEEEIEKWRRNMRKAIETLEGFFSDKLLRTTVSFESVQLPPTLLSLDVAEDSVVRAAATSVSFRSHRSPTTLASAAIKGRGTPIDGTQNACHPHSH